MARLPTTRQEVLQFQNDLCAQGPGPGLPGQQLQPPHTQGHSLACSCRCGLSHTLGSFALGCCTTWSSDFKYYNLLVDPCITYPYRSLSLYGFILCVHPHSRPHPNSWLLLEDIKLMFCFCAGWTNASSGAPPSLYCCPSRKKFSYCQHP